MLEGISADITSTGLKNFLESLKDIGSINVQRSKDCAGYKYNIKWLNGGDKQPIAVNLNHKIKFS